MPKSRKFLAAGLQVYRKPKSMHRAAELPHRQRLWTHLLCIPCCLCIILVVTIAVVPVTGTPMPQSSIQNSMQVLSWLPRLPTTLLNSPGRSMGLPGAQTHPAELSFAVLVPTDHVVAAPVLLDGDVAFWALLWTGHRALSARKARRA